MNGPLQLHKVADDCWINPYVVAGIFRDSTSRFTQILFVGGKVMNTPCDADELAERINEELEATERCALHGYYGEREPKEGTR